MYNICIESSLLLTGYCFVARRRSAISLSSASASCCFSSALLCRALAFVTNDNSPLFSHFSYNSFEVDRREETSVFNRLRLPSNSCMALVLVHGQVTVIFEVSVGLSVCCLFVCAEFFSAVFDPISIKYGHVICLGLVVSRRI